MTDFCSPCFFAPLRLPFVATLLALAPALTGQTVNDLGDVPSGSYDLFDSIVTLREAVEVANANPGSDTVRFAHGLSGTITLQFGQIDITDDLRIRGRGASQIAVSGGSVTRLFQIPAAVGVEIERLTLRNGWALDFGGGIFNDGSLSISSCRMTENVATREPTDTNYGGGAIENRGVLVVHGCIFDFNEVEGTHEIFEEIENGGAAINSTGELYIYDSDILNNRSFNAGGIRVANSTMTMERCLIANNSASGIVGGGMVLVLSVTTIRDSWLENNDCIGPFGNSGAISNEASNSTFERLVIRGNRASGFGGGVSVAPIQEGGPTTVVARNCLVEGNSSQFGAGFAVIDGNTLDLRRSVVVNNSAGDGGAIWVGNFLNFLGNSSLRMERSIVSSNDADRGAGVFVQTADAVDIDGSLITWNNATTAGGGIYLEVRPPIFDLGNSLLFGNQPENLFEE